MVTSCMEYTRCTTLGTNLPRSAILIYLARGERGNEGIIHRPKDESEFLAKKKTFEANIFKFFLKGDLGNFSRAQPPIPLGNFYLLTPPPPRNFHWPSVGGGGMDIFWNHTL